MEMNFDVFIIMIWPWFLSIWAMWLVFRENKMRMNDLERKDKEIDRLRTLLEMNGVDYHE